jgi:hypothetical protein
MCISSNFSLGLTKAYATPNAASSQDPTSHRPISRSRYAIWSLRRHPIANVRCCAERFCPTGFQHTQMVKHGALGTGEYPICPFYYTTRCRVVRDWGAAWSIVLAQMSRMLPIDNSRTVHHELMHSLILFPDSLSTTTLNTLNASTADWRAAALSIPRHCGHPQRRTHILSRQPTQ